MVNGERKGREKERDRKKSSHVCVGGWDGCIVSRWHAPKMLGVKEVEMLNELWLMYWMECSTSFTMMVPPPPPPPPLPLLFWILCSSVLFLRIRIQSLWEWTIRVHSPISSLSMSIHPSTLKGTFIDSFGCLFFIALNKTSSTPSGTLP